MNYVTNDDIEARLGSEVYVQLTDDDRDGTADVGVVDEARVGVEGEVDSYLARGYRVPIDVSEDSELAGLLKSIVLDLVELRLRSRRPPVPEAAKRQGAEAMSWLAGVACGSIDLPNVSRIATPAPEGPKPVSTGESRILTHDELSDF